MKGLHPDLISVAHRALELSPIDFMITEGVRSVTEQGRLVKIGASRTMNSRHLTGHALDVAAIVDGRVRWDWPLYDLISVAFKQAAKELEVDIVWGGDWTTFKDGPHFELDRKSYP